MDARRSATTMPVTESYARRRQKSRIDFSSGEIARWSAPPSLTSSVSLSRSRSYTCRLTPSLGENDEYATRFDWGNHSGDSSFQDKSLILRKVPSLSETTKMSRLAGGVSGVALACT